MRIKEIKIKRVIIHKIIAKKADEPAYLIASRSLHSLDEETKETLKSRVLAAVNKSKRFFETKIDNTGTNSFWSLAKNITGSDKKRFIKLSIQIGDLAVETHQNALRPGGLLIVTDCEIDAKDSVIIIKAELQEALTLKGDSIELMKELFLSPAKEFYKMGMLAQKGKRSSKTATSFLSYVYDDNFNPKKDDIAEYFYKDFLGFSTSENDKLRTNNFLKDVVDFVDHNVSDHTSRKHIKIRIKADYRESSNMIIDPTSYSDFFNERKSLGEKFGQQILSKYPISFTKDLTLVERSLKKGTLEITDDLKVVGPAEVVDSLEVINPNTRRGARKLSMEIDSGNIAKVVLINNSNAVSQESDLEEPA